MTDAEELQAIIDGARALATDDFFKERENPTSDNVVAQSVIAFLSQQPLWQDVLDAVLVEVDAGVINSVPRLLTETARIAFALGSVGRPLARLRAASAALRIEALSLLEFWRGMDDSSPAPIPSRDTSFTFHKTYSTAVSDLMTAPVKTAQPNTLPEALKLLREGAKKADSAADSFAYAALMFHVARQGPGGGWFIWNPLDEKTGPICRQLAGKTLAERVVKQWGRDVAWGAISLIEFRTAGSVVRRPPPYHPRCRSYLVPLAYDVNRAPRG